MDFLFKDRGSGKRTIKPSKDSESLEACMAAEESDDSDFEVDKHRELDSDQQSDSGESRESGDGSSGSSGDEDDDEDDEELDKEEEELNRRAQMTTEELMAVARARAAEGAASGGAQKRHEGPKVCGTCLGDSSDHTNEIVECDGCGVAVHEACYGIQESGSLYSNTGSEASTEPWFCEPCMAGVKSPHCEVCPRVGGIYKETDVGNWIHLVCALYIPQISFFDQDRITKATLFELNYQHWGKRHCTLCKDVKLARTGLCIECDAGMCRQYFHVSCAQEAGLLSEPSDSDSEQFFGHCRAHTKSELLKKRKKNFLQHQLHYRSREAAIRAEEETGGVEGGETARQRIHRKLRSCQLRWRQSREEGEEGWVPTQKMPRLLLTSSKAVRKLLRRNELHGWNQRALDQEAHDQRVVANIRKKWGIAPALTVEFVAYYHDRGDRVGELQRGLATRVLDNARLVGEDQEVVNEYRRLANNLEEEREKGERLRQEVGLVRTVLGRLDPLKRGLEEDKEQGSASGGAVSPLRGGRRRGEVGECAACRGVREQHLMAHCDTCDLRYHLACLSPPLAKMPRNTKQYSWQCNECDRKKVGSFDIPVQVDTTAPRASRTRISMGASGDGSSSQGQTSKAQLDANRKALVEAQVDADLKASELVRRGSEPVTSDSDVSSAVLSPPLASSRRKPGPKPGQKRGRGRRTSGRGRENDEPVAVEDEEEHGGKKGRVEEQEEGDEEGKENPPPPKVTRRGRRSRPRPPSPPTPTLPPKKFFKNREETVVPSSPSPPAPAVVSSSLNLPREVSSSSASARRSEALPTLPNSSKVIPPNSSSSKAVPSSPTPSSESRDFKQWLETKLSPSPVSSVVSRIGTSVSSVVSRIGTSEHPHGTARSQEPTQPIPELARPSNPDSVQLQSPPVTPLPPPSPHHSLPSPPQTNGILQAGEDASSDDEFSPLGNNKAADCSLSSLSQEEELKDSQARSEAKIERKRLKREEKEKRREERRKKKLLQRQGEISEGPGDIEPQFEEDEDGNCVIRITPKPVLPIKLKIKPIMRPELDEQPNPPSYPMMMHPKKKIAHMELENIDMGSNSRNGSAQDYSAGHQQAPSPPPAVTSTTGSDLNCDGHAASPLTLPPHLSSPLPGSSAPPPTNLPLRLNGNGLHSPSPTPSASTSIASTSSTPTPGRRGGGGKDPRTHCDVCRGDGTNANLVRCDECRRCFHFSCLLPPVKKTPKVPGWGWSCADCSPSEAEVDKSWHL